MAIFGFFIALGRNTQAFLSANGFDSSDELIEGLTRYAYIKLIYPRRSILIHNNVSFLSFRFLIGGSVLFYPQLSSISSYQLYVEVSI